MTAESLLKGVIDFHVHAEPSMMERACDFVELCYLAEKAGYRAVAHKDHNYASAGLAQQIKKHLFPNSPLQIFGTIALNHAVGGLNPAVLETALDFGTKVVWFPTVSAKNHIEFFEKKAQKNGLFQRKKEASYALEPILLIDDNGELTEETVRLLELLAKYPDVVIGSNHGYPAEIDALIDKCDELGILDRFFVDHPNEIIGADLDTIIRWAKRGATIELVAAMSVPPTVAITVEETAEYVRAIGPEHIVFASDLGQANRGNPVAAYGKFLLDLYNCGISEDDIRYMTSTKPAQMMGLDR